MIVVKGTPADSRGNQEAPIMGITSGREVMAEKAEMINGKGAMEGTMLMSKGAMEETTEMTNGRGATQGTAGKTAIIVDGLSIVGAQSFLGSILSHIYR